MVLRLFAALGFVVLSCGANTSAQAEQKSGNSVSLPQETEHSWICYGENANERNDRTAITTSRFRLLYPTEYERTCDIANCLAELDLAYAQISKQLGPFVHSFDVILAESISPKERVCTNGRIVAICVDNGETTIVVRRDRIRRSVLTHEFTHAWFNQQKKEPVSWLEEGIAEYVETLSEDGYSEFHMKRLRKTGLLCASKFGQTARCSDESKMARSTAWWLVYFLAERKGVALSEIDGRLARAHYEEAAREFHSLR